MNPIAMNELDSIRMVAPPIEPNPARWPERARFWATAVAVVCLLAAGTVLMLVDWNYPLFTDEEIFAIILAAPAPIYLGLAFFIRVWQNRLCLVMSLLAVAHAVLLIGAPFFLGTDDEFPWFLAGALGIAGGLLILAAASFRAWQSRHAPDNTRGFKVIMPEAAQS